MPRLNDVSNFFFGKVAILRFFHNYMFSKQFSKKKGYRISELKKISVLHIFPDSKFSIKLAFRLNLRYPCQGVAQSGK